MFTYSLLICTLTIQLWISSGTNLYDTSSNGEPEDYYCEECCQYCDNNDMNSSESSATTEPSTSTYYNTSTSEETTTYTTTEPSCDVNSTLEAFKRKLIPNTIKFLSEVVKNKPKANAVICAPLASYYLLAALLKFSYGPAYYQILQAFNLNTINQVVCVITAISQYLSDNQNKVDFKYKGVAIFGNNQLPFTSAFKNFVDNPIFGGTRNVGFKENVLDAVNDMNDEFAQLTQGKVTEVYTSTAPFSRATQLVSGVGQYFSSTLQIGFQSVVTQGPFYVTPTKTIMRGFQFRRAVSKYKYSPVLKAKLVELQLPGDYSVIIVLPNAKNGLKPLLRRLSSDYDTFHSEFLSMKDREVSVLLPTYDIISTSVKSMPIIRKALSVSAIFNSSQLHLANAIKGDKIAAVSYAQHKNILKLNYSGGSSPPANGNNTALGADVYCQWPFIFLINLKDFPAFAGAGLR